MASPHAWSFWITHNDTSKPVGLLWTSFQPVAETSTWQHTTLTTYRHPCPQPNSNPPIPASEGPARPRTQHDCHHDTKVKPEAATAVIELLMMGGKTPETCWAVNKRQDNKLENCCIWLVIYLNYANNFVIMISLQTVRLRKLLAKEHSFQCRVYTGCAEI